MKRTLILTAAIVVSFAGLLGKITPSRAQESKFHHTENAISNQYIVVLDPETSASQVSSTAQSLAATYGGQVGHIYEHALKGFSLETSEATAINLSNDSVVEYVEEDGLVTVTGTQLTPPSWGLDRIDQRNLPLNTAYTYKPTGRGVNAYVIDTGIRPTHQDFHGRAFVAFDATGGNGIDCLGHGTHVAGILGASSYGVAKGVTIYGVRVLTSCNLEPGSISNIIAGVDWVTEHRINPAVVNVSLSAGAISTSLDTAVLNSINSGLTYVIGAGNEGTTITSSPARVAAALTVGATDDSDQRAVFTTLSSSNFGPLLDVFAPGKFITSTWYNSDTAVETISGTSMAAPHVAGIVAQYLQLNPTASPATVHAAIVNNATTGVVVNPGTNTPNRLAYSNFLSEPPQATSTDFDADGKADVAVWRPGTGDWHILFSATSTTSQVQWGAGSLNDQIVPGDYDGDDKADRAVWRPGSSGVWSIINSSNNTQRYEYWGTSGDIPVPADYDGDTITDIAVWRPSNGVWYIIESSTSNPRYETFGTSGDKPIAGDYDGDGKADVAVWRPSNGIWYILNSSTGTVRYETFGGASFNDVLVPADYDGDVSVDVAVWRPSSGIWYILQSTTGTVRYETFGLSSDIPATADYDGDGKNDVAVWRPSNGIWYIIGSSTSTVIYQTFGTSGDVPIPSAYNRY
ncbi:MAG TPA: S8 family serine peptidase [Pyrinomonadaceae bacterium]|nr:S8 family serine peptidase [Pyrinomonadaceae bacterium]